jgi:hypothetical protein
VVDADHAQWRALGPFGKGNSHCGLVKSGCDGIDRDRIVGVGPEGDKTQNVSENVLYPQEFKRVTYVSALTSQMTDKRRFGEERDSVLTKGGILAER